MAVFKVIDGEQVRTKRVTIASATVIPAGAFAGMTNGLAVDAIETTAKIAWCPAGSADGETVCELSIGKDFVLEGTADAVFAVTQKGAEVDLTAAQLIDVGSSSTDVLLQDISENAGVVGSVNNVRVRINKPLF
jgi:hypothetical protein